MLLSTLTSHTVSGNHSSLGKEQENSNSYTGSNSFDNTSIVSIDYSTFSYMMHNSTDNKIDDVDFHLNVSFSRSLKYYLYVALLDKNTTVEDILSFGYLIKAIEVYRNISTIGLSSLDLSLSGDKFYQSYYQTNVSISFIWYFYDNSQAKPMIEWSDPLAYFMMNYLDFVLPNIVITSNTVELSYLDANNETVPVSSENIAELRLDFIFNATRDTLAGIITVVSLGEVIDGHTTGNFVAFDKNVASVTNGLSGYSTGNHSVTIFYALAHPLNATTSYRLFVDIIFFSPQDNGTDFTYLEISPDVTLNETNFANNIADVSISQPDFLPSGNDKVIWLGYSVNSKLPDSMVITVVNINAKYNPNTSFTVFAREKIYNDYFKVPLFHPNVNKTVNTFTYELQGMRYLNNHIYRYYKEISVTVDLSDKDIVSPIISNVRIDTTPKKIDTSSSLYDILNMNVTMNITPPLISVPLDYKFSLRLDYSATDYYMSNSQDIPLVNPITEAGIYEFTRSISGYNLWHDVYGLPADNISIIVNIEVVITIDGNGSDYLEMNFQKLTDLHISDFNSVSQISDPNSQISKLTSDTIISRSDQPFFHLDASPMVLVATSMIIMVVISQRIRYKFT